MIEGQEQARVGQITSGIAPGTLVSRTLAFVREQLPTWRDDPSRPVVGSEPVLNSQLCKFLNAQARSAFPMLQFTCEEPQQGHRSVDFAASLTEDTLIEAKQFSIYEPLLLLEGKRLPSPSSDREKEYVSGLAKKSGGIQRFKLGLYGAEHEVAAIIGFIQSGTIQGWHSTVNSWIDQFSTNARSDLCRWRKGDKLKALVNDRENGVASCRSSHDRGGTIRTSIELHHLWVLMSKP